MSNSGQDRRLRVLTLVDGIGTYGGGERVARQITTHLDRDRFEATLCVSRWEPAPLHDAALEELRDADVAFLGLQRSSRLQLRPWRQLIAYMRDWGADVLHSHKVGSNAWGVLIAPRTGVPVFVAHEHTWSYQGKPYRRWLDRYLISRRADAFVAVSREDRRRMTAVEHIPEARTRFIPNGIAPPPAPDPLHDVRVELGIRPDQPVVGVVATLRPQKALDVLLRASARLRERYPDVRILIVGGTDDREEAARLHTITGELDLDRTVTFLGSRTDVSDLIGIFDVAVLSSDFEGSPLSVLEYMDAAKPVVATRVGGVPDIVIDGVTGLLVERQDPGAMAAATATLLDNPELAARIGAAGRARCRQEFSIEAATRRVEALYEELFAAKRGTAPG